MKEERFCPLCNKKEKRSECSYGGKVWDIVTSDEKTPAEVDGVAESYVSLSDKFIMENKDLRSLNWKDSFKPTEYEFIDLIKPEPIISEECCSKCGKNPCECELKKPRGGSAAKPGPDKNYVKPMGESIEEATRLPAKTGNIIYAMVSWRGRVYSLQMFFPSGKRPSRQEVQDQVRKVYPDSRLTYFNVRDYEPGQPLLQVEEAKVDKDKMKCNKPKAQAVGDSLTGKSHVVKACSGGEEKIIRFGQRGVKGSPKKEGESEGYAARRKAFKDRHAKNISKGKMSAAYWANKVKW